MKELTGTFAGQEIIDRTLVNAWQDSRVHEAVTQAGRTKILIAGTGLDVCAQLPALACTAEGYDAYVIIDACGRFTPVPSVATVSRLTQAGVALIDTRVLVLEAMADNAHPKASEIYAILTAGLVSADAANQAEHSDHGMALAGDYEPSALDWVREHVEQILRTGTTDGVTMSGRPTVLMTYRGAKTGKVRKTPVMRVEHDGRYAAVASKGGEPTNPQWYASLAAEPLVQIQDGAVTRVYRAREVSGDEKAFWWHRAVDAFPDYAAYQRGTDRQIPVFVLEPVSSADRT